MVISNAEQATKKKQWLSKFRQYGGGQIFREPLCIFVIYCNIAWVRFGIDGHLILLDLELKTQGKKN